MSAPSSASSIVPRARPSPSASAAIVASWQVKALVEATPISGPARVGAAASVSRAMLESGTLTTPIVFDPCAWTYLSEASVSAVSPDWEMTIESPFGSTGASR